ncbi:MAG: excinuclease ABC subunit UvrB, partial [Myxococcota bacterium]
QTLYGVTGSGKTLTMAWVVEAVQRPTLVLAHNKTLAAQLYGEFREIFPHNAVEYFVSYYDYYQPEAYVPTSDVYIPKEADINEQIDRMRHAATRSLLERRDVLIVASVSCIYGIGSSEVYREMLLHLHCGDILNREKLLKRLVALQYGRNDIDFHRGTFRVRGDRVEIFPAHQEEYAVRIEFWDDQIETLSHIDPIRGKTLQQVDGLAIYPNSHYATNRDQVHRAIRTIQEELQQRLEELRNGHRLVEEQRLRERTMCDIEMLEQTGFCPGIENYARHLSGRQPGAPPPCLLDYFPEDFLMFVDESHVTLPQVRGMYKGDQSRKRTLVEHGFRMPSAMDNRPLQFSEFEALQNQTIFVSATPGPYEIEQSTQVVEQIIRPTGLLDPEIEIRPVANQVDDLFEEIRKRVEREERVLITTLTKRMAEKLSEYYQEAGFEVRYIHSGIDTLERVRLLRDLRQGLFDVLIGVNLLREGLDLPEVSLVAILDADQQGFLRNARSLLQTVGRAARNQRGYVILYADRITDAMQTCIDITQRQRAMQMAYNQEHNIQPKSIQKQVATWVNNTSVQYSEHEEQSSATWAAEQAATYHTPAALNQEIEEVERAMLQAASQLRFEKAAELRDRLAALRQLASLLFDQKA